jgi:hypothetical protein
MVFRHRLLADGISAADLFSFVLMANQGREVSGSQRTTADVYAAVLYARV